MAATAELKRNKTTYLHVRKKIVVETDSVKRASYFYYLNRNCFNGLYRTNKLGHFNVPFSKSRTGEMLAPDEFFASSAALRSAKLSIGDFETIISRHLTTSAFFFLDPPYAVRRRRPFTEYSGAGFNEDDLGRLLGCLEAIDDSGGRFAVTYDSTLAKRFSRRAGWHQAPFVVRRNISGFAKSRRNATEILTTNFKPA